MFANISKVEGLYKVRICTQCEIKYVKYFNCLASAGEYAMRFTKNIMVKI